MADRVFSWWIPAAGISREVIQVDICRYLGNDAVCRPGPGRGGRDEGVPGYWISAYRNFTDAMIQDLKADSANWQRERSSSGGRYEHSQVHRSRQYWGPTESRQQTTQTAQPSTQQYPSYGQQPSGYGQPQQSAYGQQSQSTYGQQPTAQYPSGASSYPTNSGYSDRPASTPSTYGQQPQGGVNYASYGYQQQAQQSITQSPSQSSSYTTSTSYSTPQGQQPGYQLPNEPPRAYSQPQYQSGQPAYSQATSTQSQQVRPGYYLASDGRQYPYPSTSQ